MTDHNFDFTFPLARAIPIVCDGKTHDQGGVLSPGNMEIREGSGNNVHPPFRFIMSGPSSRSPEVAMKNLAISNTTPEQHIEQTLPAVLCHRVALAAPAAPPVETPKLSPGPGMPGPDDAGLTTHTDAVNELQLKSPLVCINYDVQEHIMSFLPGSSLTALMMTCRYFSEAALPSLCKLAWFPFCWDEDLLSFRSFLRVGSPTHRWSHIRQLDFRLPWLTSEPLIPLKLHQVRQHGESLMDVLLHVLRACRNLESLRIPSVDLCRELDIGILCHIISTLPALTELRMALPQNLTARMLRQLVKPQLRTFTLYHHKDYDVENLEIIQHFRSLRQSLVELCLPRFHGSIFPPDMVFPGVQRLTIGFPGPTPQSLPDVLRQSFPNLLHLRMTGNAAWHYSTSDAGRAQLDSLREHHEREWRSKPNAWPALASLSCYRMTSESGLYGLAIPRHIPYLSVGLDSLASTLWQTKNARLYASRSAALVADVRPSCLELRMAICHWSFRATASEDDSAGCLEFNILHTSAYPYSLRRFVLAIQGDSTGNKGKTAMDALCRELPQLSLTHLLIRHCSDPPETWALHHREETLAQQEWMTAINASAYETAAVLVEASRTLRWVAIQAHGRALRSWEVLRPPPPSGSATDCSAPNSDAHTTSVVLRELDKDSGINVMVTEGMVDVESTFVRLGSLVMNS